MVIAWACFLPGLATPIAALWDVPPKDGSGPRSNGPGAHAARLAECRRSAAEESWAPPPKVRIRRIATSKHRWEGISATSG
jgi:hypothetical protein